MVGRSKKTSLQPECFTSGNSLETTNVELAKALAEVKNLLKQAINERNYFQKEWFMATLRLKKLESYINNIDRAAQDTITSVVSISNHTTDIMRYINSLKRISKLDESNLLHSPKTKTNTPENKMQVVKPMISGHVILRPTINLRRVNEISLEEIERLQSGNSSQRIISGEDAGQNNSPNNDSFQRLSIGNRIRRHSGRQYEDTSEENEDNNDELDGSTNSSDSHEEVHHHLGTIEEEGGMELERNNSSSVRRSSLSSNRSGGTSLTLPSTSAQVPLLSGVFKDVRVYLSPVDPHCHVTKVRGSSKSHFKRSSEIQLSRLSVNMSNSSLPENLNAHEAEDSENSLHITNDLSPLKRISATSTPHQSTSSYIENSHLSNNFDTDSPNSGRNINANIKNKRWLENNKKYSDYFHNSKKLLFPRTTRSTNGNALLNDDPLEGPSNLLDSYESNKLQTLGGLGLKPVSQLSPSPKSSSPASRVLQRRTRKMKEESDDSTPTKRTKLYVTKRKSDKRKRVSKLSKVLNSGMSPESPPKRPKKSGKRKTEISRLMSTSPSNSSFTHMSPQLPRSKKSPLKRQRKKVSMKEPSLRQKLRRSK